MPYATDLTDPKGRTHHESVLPIVVNQPFRVNQEPAQGLGPGDYDAAMTSLGELRFCLPGWASGREVSSLRALEDVEVLPRC